jgi:hypothetical protein
MTSARRWLSTWAATLVFGLSLLGCGGQSSSSDSRDDGRGGTDSSGSGRGGSAGGTGQGGRAAGGTGQGGATPGGTGQGGTTGESLIVLEDPNNYRATSSLSIPIVDTAPGADLRICWSEVDSDLSCAAVDPEADIAAVEFIRFRGISEEEIAEVLSVGELEMSTLDAYLRYDTDRQSSCTELSSLTNFGTPVDVGEEYVADPNRKYLFMVSRGAAPGAGVVSIVFARPTADSVNMTLNLQPGCGLHKLEAEFGEPVRFSYDTPWIVDYRNLTRDASGGVLNTNALEVLVLSFFAGATLSELEARVVELDSIATESFELDLTGAGIASLSDAISRETGEAFAGFERPESGIWLLRLACSTCFPAVTPVLAVLEPL